MLSWRHPFLDLLIAIGWIVVLSWRHHNLCLLMYGLRNYYNVINSSVYSWWIYMLSWRHHSLCLLMSGWKCSHDILIVFTYSCEGELRMTMTTSIPLFTYGWGWSVIMTSPQHFLLLMKKWGVIMIPRKWNQLYSKNLRYTTPWYQNRITSVKKRIRLVRD